METPIRFTKEAFKDCNIEQAATILSLANRGGEIVVMKDFSLPVGYVAFEHISSKGGTRSIYGGIDPEGKVST